MRAIFMRASLIFAEQANTKAAKERAESQEQRAKEEEQKAKDALVVEQQLREDAEQRFQLALRSVDEMAAGRRPYDDSIWRVVSFGAWLERFDVCLEARAV